jgi:hypothetical protein
MNRKIVLSFYAIIGILLAVGCAEPRYCGFKQSELEESFVPLAGYVAHPPVPCEHVVFMESAPTNRTYQEVALISPRGAYQKSWGDAVHAALAAAALKGADAVYPLSEKDKEASGFSFSANGYGAGGHGGKHSYVDLRIKAIVWTEESK